MKIFNRGTETKAPAAAAVTTTPQSPSSPPRAAPAGPAAAAAHAPPPVAEPISPPAPDLSIILDANVKEMSEKIARLASTLESNQTERTGFEAKIEQMEERMRKLSSLTEMISAQYNPFVGDAPAERDPLPHPEVGLAPPAVPSALLPPPSIEAAPPAPAPGLSLSLAPADMPAAELAPTYIEPAPSYETPQSATPPAFALAAVPPSAEPSEPGVYVWSIAPGFESSMLLLGWADMLLKNAGTRESLLELVNYYHNIGWIGDPARDQLLGYADGLTAPESASTRDWRANVEVHEKSLLFVEKLRAVGHRRHG